MNIEFKTLTSKTNVVDFLAKEICTRLEKGEKVLWFATGGSSIPIVVETAKIISQKPHKNLTVTLTDERYGPINHPDSNWNQLIEKGFSLPEANLIPVLTGDDRQTTAEKFNTVLENVLVDDMYKIGLFGIGPDGHTAGILPNTKAAEAQTLAFGYETPSFERITMTTSAISKLDEVVVYAIGENKWPTLANLKENLTFVEQPAQALKQVNKVTIFTDYH